MTTTSPTFDPTSVPARSAGRLAAFLRALLRIRAEPAGDETLARREAERELDAVKARLGTLPHAF
ncbi:MAG TPA: hypothetical protein PKA33_06030 [Amaricoccus sp.]|uniref:hypothetical protein n=1 Tax=Amaricoccus sp. TaxID=1872485 RepID=UPI002CE80BE4|nr:hypothetical protein [Amaricoccus sp.]HMQ92537.1 hypothetical protein [Amaricoccus sp.]HMR52116.1 hypothetical protein [Amaricoccus sp.]HMR60121.1 hypothetical protein [Amaricoccus sp.]HMT98918.1 hypothetical protein [Amaricoccus sp.]